jgi:hypothetical protein
LSNCSIKELIDTALNFLNLHKYQVNKLAR